MNEKYAFIRNFKFEDIVVHLPEVNAWDGEDVCPDLFICTVGFEARATAIPKELARRLKANSTQIALIGEYETNTSDNDRNRSEIIDSLKVFCSDVQSLEADTPISVQRDVSKVIEELNGQLTRIKVAIDVSGASSTFILSVLASLLVFRERITLDVLYCEPEEYFPGKELFQNNLDQLLAEAVSDGDDDSFMEQGVSDVDVNEIYQGISVENRPDYVIAIPSMRTPRLVRCIAHIGDELLAAPVDSICWILGEPPDSSLRWRFDLQKRIVNKQIAVMIGKDGGDMKELESFDGRFYQCSTRDYRQIIKTLIEKIDMKAGSNLYLVNMGSKLQSVGIALTLAVRSEVAVLHARPTQFNPMKYSRGIGTLWRINFNNPSDVIKVLQQIGQMDLETKTETSRECRPPL
jgi:hypothetical protein